MNEANRLLLVFFAAACIVTMAVIIFVTWAAPTETIDRLGDFVEFLGDNETTGGKLIVTLAALATAVIALLIIVVELAPADEAKELRVEQAGATTIIPADALRLRLEEALLLLPDVTAARSRVWSRDKGIAAELDLTVTQTANVANVTQEATRVVVDTVQTDLGLPVVGVPAVKIAFGGSRPGSSGHAADTPMRDAAPLDRVETVDERITAPPDANAAHADPSPGPLVYEETPAEAAPEEPTGDATQA